MEFFDARGNRVQWNGEEVTPRVGAYAVIERDMGPEYHELLMVRTHTSGLLELPGGGLEPGKETLREAAMRECMEEINCRVHLSERVFFQEDRGFYWPPTRSFEHACNHWFLASTSDIPSIASGNDEIIELIWVEVSSILEQIEEIASVHRGAVRALFVERYGLKLKFQRVAPGVAVVKTYQRPRRCGIRR